MLALEKLRLLGYRRIGLLIHPDADRRHQGKYQAAVAYTATTETPEPLVCGRSERRRSAGLVEAVQAGRGDFGC
jgi:hypothetical protein